DAAFDEIFETVVEQLVAEQILVDDGMVLQTGSGADGWSGKQWLDMFAGILRNFFEGYRIAARGLTVLLNGPVAEKELQKRSLADGHTMYLSGEISCREAVSKPLLQNAHHALIDF